MNEPLQKIAYALRKDREARGYDNRSPVRDDALADVEFVRDALLEAGLGRRNLPNTCLIRAGRSDKYGQIYVERIGNTGFPDADEPMTLIRAQDRQAHKLMVYWLQLSASAVVGSAQWQSVARQVHLFMNWQEENPDKVRTPGATDEE